MITGIAIYPGLDNSPEENLALIEAAAKAGCTRLFTSLQIPEADSAKLKEEFTAIAQTAEKYNLDIISDVSPQTLDFLALDTLDLDRLATLGIKTVRFDSGYEPEEIAAFTHNKSGLQVQLNASTVTREFLQELRDARADFRCLDALHNFYPRSGTGLSERFFSYKTELLHSFGIRVGAFLPSLNKPRSPIKAGLPTLEQHRRLSAELAARHLSALGCDMVFIGDSLPRTDELTAIGRVTAGVIELSLELNTADELTTDLLKHTFTTRADEAALAFRAQESRALLRGLTIEPNNQTAISRGSVTLDNSGYGRYSGELQISKTDQPADDRINVIGQIPASELFLLDYLRPETKFRFKNIITKR